MRSKKLNTKRRKSRKLRKTIRKQKGGGIYENDVIKIFISSGVSLRGKRCLDIGSRDGANCTTMAMRGASEVIGIDIDDGRFNEMPPNDRVKLIKVNLLDYDDKDGFDVITCFLWNMRTYEYPQIINKIKSLLKPNGQVIISIVDDIYKTGTYNNFTGKYLPHTGSVPELFKENFTNVDEIISPDTHALYLIASKPI